MVLRLDVGEEVRRNLVIENVNEVPLTIEMIASGDLANNIKFEENGFVLQPGEEKKVYFTIKATQPGSTETRINVMFKPPQGSGVGLSANIVVITGGEAYEDEDSASGEETQNSQIQDSDNGSNLDNKVKEKNIDSSKPYVFTPITFLTISTVALIIIFITLIFVYSGKLNRKKRAGRPRE